MGDHVFLKVMPKIGVIKFGKRGKLSSRYIEIFEILEMVGTIAYRLELPPSLSSVHEVFHVSILRKYTRDPAHVVGWGGIIIDTDRTFEEGLVRIMDSRDQVLQCKTVKLVKVLWQHRGVEEATWEREDTMWSTYPFLFEDEGALYNIWNYNNYCICMCLCVLVCVNFEEKIMLRGEECKTWKKFNFSKRNGKTVILVRNLKIS